MKSKRKSNRIFTGEESEKCNEKYCKFHGKKNITNVERGKTTYLSASRWQILTDSREKQMEQRETLELHLSEDPHKSTGKLFQIEDIIEGRIEGIKDKYNGYILKLIRVQ
tara:strand:+ start:437 stop:766 length:330 start_codon:yes stop_codon:yes gene_type:complete